MMRGNRILCRDPRRATWWQCDFLLVVDSLVKKVVVVMVMVGWSVLIVAGATATPRPSGQNAPPQVLGSSLRK